MMLSGSKTMSSSFSDFTLSTGEDQVHRVSFFNYLGVVLDEKWKWKMHVNSLLQKLGYRLSLFSRIYHILDEKSLTAYFNGLSTTPRLCRCLLRRSAWSNNTDETIAIIPKPHCKEDLKRENDIS